MIKKDSKLRKEIKETTIKEFGTQVFQNFAYGFLGAILIVSVSSKVDIAVLFSYVVYYFFVGKVINRPKYVTSLGKFIVFPVPSAVGAFVGYKLSSVLLPLIT